MRKLTILLSAMAIAASSLTASAANIDFARLKGKQHLPLMANKANRPYVDKANRLNALSTKSTDPSFTIEKTSFYGTIDGPDDSEWMFTQTFTDSPTNMFYYGSSTVSIYNNKNEKVCEFTVTIPNDQKVNQITPFGKVSKSFFDKNTSTYEFMVYTSTVVKPGVIRGDVIVYNSLGKKVRTFEGATSALLFSEGNSDWNKKERLAIVTTEEVPGEKEPIINNVVSIYRKATMSDQVSDNLVSEHTFKFDSNTINYSDGMWLDIKYINGEFYYILAHYEKPFVAGTDYDTGQMIFTENNFFLTEVYNSKYERVAGVKIPVEKKGYIPTMHGYGILSDYDFSKGMFSGDDNINLIITHQDYNIATDGYLYSFDVYNADGTLIKHISDNVTSWQPMSSIKGEEEQMAFLKNLNATEQVFELVDLPSAKIAQVIPAELDGKLISTNIDRIQEGDTYNYAIGIGQGDSDEEGNVISSIAWYTKDLKFIRYTKFNLGKNAELFTPVIFNDYLNPYLFDTDDEREYIFIAKIRREGSEVIDNVLCIANEDGSMIRQFKGDTTKGNYLYGSILGLGSQNPTLYVVYVDDNNENFRLEYYGLPFNKFNGGEGSAEKPFLVASAGDLMQIANNPSAHYKMINNIDMSNAGEWTSVDLKGGFDGGNFAISGLKVNSATDYAGLFGNIEGTDDKNKAYVKNLIIVNPVIEGNDVNMSIGALAGTVSAADITNVHIIAPTINWSSEYAASIGGIAGDASFYTNITDCLVSKMAVTSSQATNVGGIAGSIGNSSNIARCSAEINAQARSTIGGIVGAAGGSDNTGSIIDCHANAVLKGEYSLGGIAGTSSRILIKNCYAFGNITATAAESGDYSNPLYNAGGIIGSLATDWNGSSVKVVENCVAMQDFIKAEDPNNNEQKFNGVHRLVGTSVGDLGMGMSENGIGNCYANSKMLINGFTLTGTIENENGGNIVLNDLNKAFFEKNGYVYGNNADAPWTGDIIPVLYFEANAIHMEFAQSKIQMDAYSTAEATINISNGNADDITVTSSNDAIVKVTGVTVDNVDGNIQVNVALESVANGVVTLTAKLGNITATCTVIAGDASVNEIVTENMSIVQNGRNIIANGAERIEIYNLNGVCVAKANGSEMSVSNLSNGIYIAAAYNANGCRTTAKLIIR